MTNQQDLIAAVLREIELSSLLTGAEAPNSLEEPVASTAAARLVTQGELVSVRLPDEDGCGFWLPIAWPIELQPAEWWSCVIPDTEHQDRDHVLVRRRYAGAADGA